MAYTDTYASNFAGTPQEAFVTVPANTLYQQSVVALWTSAAAAIGAGVAAHANAAATVYANPISYAVLLAGAFLADPTVQANAETGCTDAQMQSAADWILTTLYP